MTLYDLFHPIVAHMVDCRHEAAQGNACAQDVLYGFVVREVARIRKVGTADPRLAAGIEDACTYTAFYIDFMVHEGPFPFAATWRDLGRSQYNELAGDEKFFDYMRRWLAEEDALALDHLRLMHAMVASGFSGAMERRHVRLESLMRQCAERLGIAPEADSTAELFRQGSPANGSMHPCKPLRRSRMVLVLGLLAMAGAVSAYLGSYARATSGLRQVLHDTIGTIRRDTILEARNSDTLVVSPIELHPDGGGEPGDAPATDTTDKP